MYTGHNAATPVLPEDSAPSSQNASTDAPPEYQSGQSLTQYAPSEPASAQTPQWTDPWVRGGANIPPTVPPYAGGEIGGPSRRRRPAWAYALVGLALLATLAGGIGIGRAFTRQAATTIGAHTSPTITVSSNVTSLQQAVENVAKAVAPSVVEITSVSGGQEAIGSGVVLTSDGYIVTNDHVVDGYTNYTVTLSSGQTLQAQLVGKDAQDDLAVVKVSATNLQPIAFTDSGTATVGEFVVAIGNPYGLRETATFGTVSAINRTASESPDGPASVLTGLIQTSAPIAPGNSGGALVNLQGQLIGIPTLGESNQQTQSGTTSSTIGFAINSNEVKTVAQQLIQNGKVTATGQGFLGIQGRDVTPALANADGLSVQSGVLVAGFVNDAAGQSPASQAGLQTGDVITAINGQAIADSSDLASAVLNQAPGTQIKVSVARGSSQLTLTLTLGERPVNA